ncbi:MAG: hypothetical protein V7K77_22785 [Nostoc sp.]|uniref:hypothetical protein n=1 Tax=Nostoc sp. TaxID=1180 RepID=UPI002FF9407A
MSLDYAFWDGDEEGRRQGAGEQGSRGAGEQGSRGAALLYETLRERLRSVIEEKLQ